MKRIIRDAGKVLVIRDKEGIQLVASSKSSKHILGSRKSRGMRTNKNKLRLVNKRGRIVEGSSINAAINALYYSEIRDIDRFVAYSNHTFKIRQKS